jgi:hypothetical protein
MSSYGHDLYNQIDIIKTYGNFEFTAATLMFVSRLINKVSPKQILMPYPFFKMDLNACPYACSLVESDMAYGCYMMFIIYILRGDAGD